jgi:hypothetical protein
VTQSNGSTGLLKGIFFTDANTGWAVGAGGVILHTSDGGAGWIGQASGTTGSLYGVHFSDANVGWVVGDFGAILHTTTGGSTWSGAQGSPLPGEHLLRQNFPNPFNSSTTIEYFLPRSTQVNLEVFNIIGERVSVLKDGLQDAGYHNIVFETDALPSGVYVYRLKTENFLETRKLVLLR